MSKGIIVGIILVVIFAFGAYMLSSRQSQPSPTQVTNSSTEKNDTTEGEESTDNTAMGKTAIEIENFAFNPKELTVKAGEEVSVTNKDTVSHTVTSDEGGLFDTGLVSQDQTKAFTAPSTPGEYPFHCTPHPNMKGTLIVEE